MLIYWWIESNGDREGSIAEVNQSYFSGVLKLADFGLARECTSVTDPEEEDVLRVEERQRKVTIYKYVYSGWVEEYSSCD